MERSGIPESLTINNMKRGGYIYIMTNKAKTTLYIGVTATLHKRVEEHKSGKGSDFTKRYKCFYLVYYKGFHHIEEAIKMEKRMKKWKRQWKDNVIEEFNSEWKDLSDDVFEHRV